MVTMFKNLMTIDEPHMVEIDAVLSAIKEGRYKEQVAKVRHAADQHERRELKSQLPCVCFSGEFTNPVEKEKDGKKYVSYRDDRSLKNHSGFVPIDIDGCDPNNKIEELKKHPFIFALWKSASGMGVHGLVKIGDPNRHSDHYRALLDKIDGLDTTAQNPSRVLFVSYDPNIYINRQCDTFYDLIQEKKKDNIIKVGNGFTDYKKIDVACKMVRNAVDGEKHHVLNKAAYLLGGFVATNTVEYNIAYAALHNEIVKRDIDDLKNAEKTIADGLNSGQYAPISEVESNYRDAVEILGIKEEDLSFLTDNSKDEEYIHRFRLGLIPQGLKFGHQYLDEHLLLKEGEFYAMLGHSHIGKSTLTLWLLFLASIHYGWNWLIYCGENSSASVKIKLMQFFMGKRIQKFTEKEQKIALKFVEEHFYLLSTNELYSYKDILQYAKTFMEYKSLKGLFIDPYNSLKIDLGKHESKYTYDYEAYSAMLTFTKKYNTSIFLSVHTTTAAQREKDNEGNQVMPHATDAEGGSALYNRCDNFITAHRKIKDNAQFMFTQISVDKVRNDDTGGRPTPKSQPVILRMNDKVEFTDENGMQPFNRDEAILKYEFKI
jgi:energy-coupling factor transporter ATP-binding protein EcfA2